MSAIPFGSAIRKNPADEQKTDKPEDAAWMVLEAANDLGDHATVETCRRVIDANLNGRAPSPIDVQIVMNYFA